MDNIAMNMRNLGFSNWFQERIDSAKLTDYQIARVIIVNKDSYIIKNDKNDVPAEITGKLKFSANSSLDYPAVGDWVYAQYFDNDSFAIIHDIFPRKTVLRRKKSGKEIDFQLMAANIDTALIMQSLDVNFNIRRLERYLVMIKESDIRTVILLSKLDLVSPTELEEKIIEIDSVMPGTQIIAFSNITDSGLDKVKKLLIPGETYCLLGSSGIGKTTLLNKLLGADLFETQSIREKDGRGRHTTSRRQLINLKNNVMVIDTPGMRELGNFGIESGLNQTFDEIAELAIQCHFSDCSHTQEAGCAVLAALKDGTISDKRYINYIKMKKESTHYEMSYLDKRRKDKQFGKFYKSVMKHKIKNKK